MGGSKIRVVFAAGVGRAPVGGCPARRAAFRQFAFCLWAFACSAEYSGSPRSRCSHGNPAPLTAWPSLSHTSGTWALCIRPQLPPRKDGAGLIDEGGECDSET